MKKRTYYALSTWNYQAYGYTLYAEADSRDAAREAGEDAINEQKHEYIETLHRNLIVVSKTESKRFRVRK